MKRYNYSPVMIGDCKCGNEMEVQYVCEQCGERRSLLPNEQIIKLNRVEDGLPKYTNIYIVSAIDPSDNERYNESFVLKYDVSKKRWEHAYFEIECSDIITHWAELPKPEEEENE